MRILIVKTSSLGDIIHTFPTLHFLRQKFPDAKIDWVVEKGFAELVKAHPFIDEVLIVDTKTWRKGKLKGLIDFRRQLRTHTYDYLFDLQGNIKSGLITWQARAKLKIGFGKKTVPESPNRWFTDRQYDPPPGNSIRADYLFLAQSHFGDFEFVDPGVQLKITEQKSLNAEGPLVMVCPGSAWRNKQLSEQTLEAFLKKVQEHLKCHFLFIWGSEQERKQVENLHTALPNSQVVPRLSLPALQNLMGQMKLVIAMDSLPLHLAGTTATQTFSIFGASSADKYRPVGERHHSFQGPCPYGRNFEKRCPILRTCETGSCIREISPDLLFDYFKLLKIN